MKVVPIPSPIRYGDGLRTRRDSHHIIERPQRGDWIDLTTSECVVARVIKGVRYDTRAALLVASRSTFDEQFFMLRQAFRGHDGRWFLVQVRWSFDDESCNDNLIAPIADEQVLPLIRSMIREEDVFTFFRGWYGGGWVPRNDAFMQQWAEEILSADDCEYVINTFQFIPDGPDA